MGADVPAAGYGIVGLQSVGGPPFGTLGFKKLVYNAGRRVPNEAGDDE